MNTNRHMENGTVFLKLIVNEYFRYWFQNIYNAVGQQMMMPSMSMGNMMMDPMMVYCPQPVDMNPSVVSSFLKCCWYFFGVLISIVRDC